MQALHRPLCLLHSTRLLQLRTLRTLPRKIPTHLERWDPTLHRSILPSNIRRPTPRLTATTLEDPAEKSKGEDVHDAPQLKITVDFGVIALSSTSRGQVLKNLFMSGREELALREWEDDQHKFNPATEQESNAEYLEIGAKLYALAGHVDRSREIMEMLFRQYPDWDPSVMMTVFRAHTSSGEKKHHELAMELYVEMKERKGAAVTMDDYDAWLVGFLEARHLTFAKQVFRDMVRDGYLPSSGAEKEVEAVLRRLHMLYRLGTDISAMTSIALDAISILPPACHGHLFGDWMKSAVVQKAPEAAAQILDLMFQRGYTPETFHFNMLLRALLRTKETPNILKAENIGWRMIDQARQAHTRSTTLSFTSSQASQNLHNPPVRETAKTAPVADVSTVALIMQHHAKNLQWEHVDYLSRHLKETAIHPNATIMNVLIDNKCRQGAYADAWSIYTRLTSPSPDSETPGVFPNGATLRHLWKTLRLALSSHATRSDPSLPSPRDLLKETVTWWTACRSRHDASRFKLGLAAADHGAVTALIMHCFSYTSDLAGSLVALHVLRTKFGIFPTDRVALILQRQVAWVDLQRESASVREQFFLGRSNSRNSERVGRVYEELVRRRIAGLEREGVSVQEMSDEEIGDLGLNLLSEFIRVVMKRSWPEEVVEAMIEAGCGAVGVKGMGTGDLNVWEVV
jgi:hypothetical protein